MCMSNEKFILSLRANKKKLHFITCRHVKRIKYETKKYFTIEEAKTEYKDLEFCKDCFRNEE